MADKQGTDFVTKIAVFENRIAEYLKVFEKRKRRKPQFAVQKPNVAALKARTAPLGPRVLAARTQF